MTRKTRNITAAAVIMTAALGLGSMGPAFAAETVPDPQVNVGGVSQESTANPVLVNKDAKVQLSIHKFYGGNTGQVNNGTIQTVDRPALKGVPFNVYQVKKAGGDAIDLKTNAGWKEAANLYKSTITIGGDGNPTIAGYDLVKESGMPLVTDEQGVATFTKDKGAGVYVVVEDLSSVTTDGTGENLGKKVVSYMENGETKEVAVDKITPAKPFLVTLPMTEPVKRQAWMYDVHVYPKNQSDTIEKTVKDEGTVTFDDNADPTMLNDSTEGLHRVTYTIKSSITDGTDPIETYKIFDTIDSRLQIESINVKLSNDPATEFKCGVDYDLTIAGTAIDCTNGLATVQPKGNNPTNGEVVISFKDTDTAAEGTQLALDKPEYRAYDVVTTIKVKLLKEGDKGLITNTASFIPNKSWEESNPGKKIDSPPVESRYGDLKIEKVDPKDGTKLKGAEFSINKAGKDGKCDDADVNPNAYIYRYVTTDDEGKAEVKGLQASDWYDGKAQTQKQGYCLVETKAPEGYNLLAEPIYFEIIANKAVVTDKDGKVTTTDLDAQGTAAASITYTVNNEKTNINNELPKTGGFGTAGLALLGLLCVGGGIAWYVVGNRKKEAQQG